MPPVWEDAAGKTWREMKRRRSNEEGTVTKKFFLLLFGLAGLGVGVWVFRSRRRRGPGGAR